VSGRTFSSLGNDVIAGDGSDETFVFASVFGSDKIIDFAAHSSGTGLDSISFASSDFANFNAVRAAAADVSGIVITDPLGDKRQRPDLSFDFRFGLN
jgi:hypothetical protein